MVPGDRPAGVFTTGELQQRVYLDGERIDGRALVAGAEHVSFSAMLTLRHAGARVLALVTEQPRHQSHAAFRLAALGWRVPVWTSTRVTRVTGASELAEVEVRDVLTGAVRHVPCETLVFTGDWIADHELARLAGAGYDPASTGPIVDTAMRTSLPGLFAAGNLVHPGETADAAALAGRHAAGHIAAALRGGPGAADRPPVKLRVAGDLAWVAPGAITADLAAPPLARFVLRGTAFRRAARVEVRQRGRLLGVTQARLVPGRSTALAAGWITRTDPAGGPVDVSTVSR
jgi:NADH dehydrogenase FAD-containing subunit